MPADQPTPRHESAQQAGVRNYQVICLAALLVLTLVFLQRGYGLWCLLPATVGVLGIFGRLRLGPILLLGSILIQLFDPWYFDWPSEQFFGLADLLQCAAVLAYAGAHYRLLGLTRGLLPADPRERDLRPRLRRTPDGPSRRAVPAREISVLLGSVAVSTVAAQLLWAWLPRSGYEYGLHPAMWRFIFLAWAGGMVVIISGGLLGYLARRHMSREQAVLFLQDVLWGETRGEQRRANRWLAWKRLRRRRDSEQSRETP